MGYYYIDVIASLVAENVRTSITRTEQM